MNILRISKASLAVLCLLAFGLTSCNDDEVATFSENRPTIVKIKDAENSITAKARDVLPTVDNFILIDLRRDPSSAAGLNEALTVKLELDPTIIDDYNNAVGTNYIELPSSAYTLSEDLSNITFAPGEFAKTISITVDKSSLSLSEQYALGVRITDASGGARISDAFGVALYSIGIKNKWDGKYRVTGTFSDVTNPLFVGTYPFEWDLITTGPNQVIVVDNNNFGFPAYPFNSAGDPSAPNTGYGSFGLVVEFDPVTDLISNLYNYYGDPTRPATPFGNPAAGTGPPLYAASNTRRAVIDPSGINAYVDGRIDIKYWLVQPSVVPAPPSIRAYFDEVWEFIGPR